jgi:hypothetical protein
VIIIKHKKLVGVVIYGVPMKSATNIVEPEATNKQVLELKRLYGECRKIVPDFYIDDKNFGCPLKKYRNKKTNKVYEVVDWFKIEEILKEKSIL